MVKESESIVVADTSVLVNFLKIDRMDLIHAQSCEVLVTNHVAAEITDAYPEQQGRFGASLASGGISQVSVSSPKYVALFSALRRSDRLGSGECSAIAFALNRNHALAIDDRRAINQARQVESSIVVQTTQDLMVSMIRDNLLTVAKADAIKLK